MYSIFFFFWMLFAHFHKSTMVPGEALFTLPFSNSLIIHVSCFHLASRCLEPMIKHSHSLLIYYVTLPRANPMGMSPQSNEIVSKTKQLPTPQGKKDLQKLNHSSWVPVGSPVVSWGSTHVEVKLMISALELTKTYSTVVLPAVLIILTY